MGDKDNRRKARMGDKGNRRYKLFNFARPKTPDDIRAHLASLLKQHRITMETGLDTDPDVSYKRALRAALGSQDVTKLKCLLKDGKSVNLVLDDVFWDTPLTFAVKHTYLEIVEMLVNSPDCDVNYHSRSKFTPLDEAIKVWITGGSTSTAKQNRARKFRVLRCILSSGAKDLNLSFLENLIYSHHNTKADIASLEKLIKVVCQKGHSKVKTAFMAALISHTKVYHLLTMLLLSGADVTYLASHPPSCHHIPEDNAIVVIKASNHRAVLRLVEQRLPIPTENRRHHLRNQRPMIDVTSARYFQPLELLISSGHVLSLQTMTYLYKNHASLYVKAIASVREPRPLRDLARMVVRRQLRPNVYHAVTHLVSIPEQVKPFLLMDKT